MNMTNRTFDNKNGSHCGIRRAKISSTSDSSNTKSTVTASADVRNLKEFFFMDFYSSSERNNVANPRNEMKPNASVQVVTSTADASAGSIFAHFSIKGMSVPMNP